MGFLSNLLQHWKKKNENRKDNKGYNLKKNNKQTVCLHSLCKEQLLIKKALKYAFCPDHI